MGGTVLCETRPGNAGPASPIGRRMTSLAKTILRLVDEGQFIVGVHADRVMEERRVAPWEVEVAMSEPRLLVERPGAKPHPEIEVAGTLSDGSPCKLCWSLVRPEGPAKLVTLHFLDHRSR
jgi:hypothetical protein